MRLKDSESKFSEDLEEYWQEYVDEYDQLSRDYNLNAYQKRQYLYNTFSKNMLRFYLDHVYHYATMYIQAVDMIDSEHNSLIRQSRVKNQLNSLRVRTFMANEPETYAASAKVQVHPEALSSVPTISPRQCTQNRAS